MYEVRKIGPEFDVLVRTSRFQQAVKWLVKRAELLEPSVEYGLFRIERHGKRVDVWLESVFCHEAT
jgi:hypothetical protein